MTLFIIFCILRKLLIPAKYIKQFFLLRIVFEFKKNEILKIPITNIFPDNYQKFSISIKLFK